MQSAGGVNRTFDFNLPSDLVRVVNSRAVCVGSSSSAGPLGIEDQTFVDVIDLSGATPVLMQQHTYNFANTNREAGHVNDVAYTPNRRYAIVNQKNTALLFDVQTGLLQVPPIALEANPIDARDPSGCVDSVVATDDVAVLITGSNPAPGVTETWVYMIEIPSGTISLRHHLLATTVCELSPHDLRMTPDRRTAVVTANNGLGFFDVPGRSLRAEVYQPDHGRLWGETVDSVSLSDEAAVVIGNDASSGTATWNAQLWDLYDDVGDPRLIAEYAGIPGAETNRAHDVIVGPPLTNIAGGTGPRAAVIRAESEILTIQDIEGTPMPTVIGVASNPLINPAPGSGGGFFTSDSAVIGDAFIEEVIVETNPTSVIRQYAVTIGTDLNTIPTSGYVQFIDLAQSPPVLDDRRIVRVNQQVPTMSCGPIDLRLTRNRDGVFVRAICDSVPGSLDPAVSLWQFAGGVVLRSTIGGTGNQSYSMDAMLVSQHDAVSICEKQGTSYPHHVGY